MIQNEDLFESPKLRDKLQRDIEIITAALPWDLQHSLARLKEEAEAEEAAAAAAAAAVGEGGGIATATTTTSTSTTTTSTSTSSHSISSIPMSASAPRLDAASLEF